jgi:hypothetical protein
VKLVLLTSFQVLVISILVIGQPVEWQEGVVVLHDGRVINGTIHYPKGFDLIFIRNNTERIVLTADKIQLFRYYDSAANINRKFVSLKGNRWGLQFYEVVVNGEVSVLRQLRRFAYKAHPDEIDSYDYFTFVNYRLEPIMRFRNRVYPKLLEERPIEIQTYVHKEQLDLNQMKSALLIIMEFNRIKQSDLQARAN